MKKSTLALAIMALIGSGAAMAASPNVKGGTSDSTGVAVGTPSNHSMFGGGNSGVKLNNTGKFIDLAGGPINGSNAVIADRGNGTILTSADMGLIGSIKVAQVWKDTESVNGVGSDYANFAVNSVRQITTLSMAPQFGGLVIGQVGENSTGAPANPVVPLAVGSGVYFGEWAPRAAGTPPLDSTNLNMTSSERTVWYVGDNAVEDGEMPTLVNAVYGVIGINQTGSDANDNTLAGGLPGNQNFYTGKLTANYTPISGSITGSIVRGSDSINFANTTITQHGTFSNGSDIEGRFYNNAEALAGIYTGAAGVADDVAFGGSKISGTITP